MNSPHPSPFTSQHPADLAPLSVGPGLALGLMLILGLPGQTKPEQHTQPPAEPPSTAPHGFIRRAMEGKMAIRDRHAGTSNVTTRG